jgi:hypothetical protein
MMSNGFHPWQTISRLIVHYFARLLTKPLQNYTTRCPNDLEALKRNIHKGDVLLVEGNQRVSEVIKYLTQSSWSHSALYIGDELVRRNHPQLGQIHAAFGQEVHHLLLEALVEEGVVVSPLSKYINFNIRVCRPHNLRKNHLQVILDQAIGELGKTYDLQNVFDLARYFLPVSLVPRRFRRTALHFGSGLPTKVICSSMIAAAFDKVGFPVVPQVSGSPILEPPSPTFLERLFTRRNGARSQLIFRRSSPTLITPRDFDLSPYFEIIKFNIVEAGRFRYSDIVWTDDANPAPAKVTLTKE